VPCRPRAPAGHFFGLSDPGGDAYRNLSERHLGGFLSSIRVRPLRRHLQEDPGFTPALEHFFATVPVAWSAEKRSAFETLYHAALARSGGGVPTVE
jgi:hypothetical protein